jgi:hypothetical protein
MLSLCLGLLYCWVYAKYYLPIHENRSDLIAFQDPIFELIPRYDYGAAISLLVYLAPTWTTIHLWLSCGFDAVEAFWCVYSVTCMLKTVSLYFLPLRHPFDYIELVDSYGRQFNIVYRNDLFFSGHTTLLALCTLFSPMSFEMTIMGLLTIVMAYMLLATRIHYTIDVLFAPIVAYCCYKIWSPPNNFCWS